MFDAVDHVGIAVAELDDALATYDRAFSLQPVHRETLASQGVEVVLLEAGDQHIELMTPISDSSPVARFLASRGPGLHHVAYRVADLDATLAELTAREVELIDKQPRTGVRESRIAFIHPRATGGVLTELVQAHE